MSRLLVARVAFLSFAAFLVNGTLAAAAVNPSSAKSAGASKAESRGKGKLSAPPTGRALPLVFEENAGQLPQGTVFAGRTNNYTVQVLPSALRFGLPGKKNARTLRVDFAGSERAKAVGVSDAGFRTNFYLGNDPTKWHTNVHNFDRIALRGLYPGIDAEFYSTGNEIEHDFIVAPGSDATKLTMHLAGATSTTLSGSGDVVLSAEEGALKLKKPHAYQVLADGSHKIVEAEFELASAGDASDLTFKLGAYDHSRELVIDPVITYATYVSGDKGSTPTAVTSDAAGNVYITGTTLSTSTSFGSSATPTILGGVTDPPTGTNAVTFIARISRTTSASTPAYINGSQLAWLTYYGDGTTPADVKAYAIAVQPGVATPPLYIAGQTSSNALPGAATDASLSSGTSTYGFIAQFDSSTGAAGSGNYATYVDGGHGIAAATLGMTQVPAVLPQNGQTTLLDAISVEASGAVTVVGNTTGNQYNGTATLVTPNVPSDFCTATGLQGAYSKGLLATFPATVSSGPTYSSYVCGMTHGSAATDTFAVTGVSPATSTTGNSTYIVAGYTDLDFPLGGPYPATPTSANFYHPGAPATSNAFAASLTNGTTPTVNWSYWSDGGQTDLANGLTVDSTAASSVIVFGSTQTQNFASVSETSNAAAPMPALNTSFGYNTYNGANHQVGFAVALDKTAGTFNGISLIAGDGTSTTSVTAAAADGAGNTLFTGVTGGTKAAFPLMGLPVGGTSTSSASRPPSVSTLPTTSGATEDLSLDPATNPGYTNGFLLRMPTTLASTDYVAFFGPKSASGRSAGVGVAVDLVSADSPAVPGILNSPPAYVLLSEAPGGSSSFTNTAAEQQAPQAGATNAAYLAQVAFVAPTATTSFTYTTTDGTYTPNPVAYSTASQSSITLTWPVKVATAGTSQLVFNLPQSPYLANYSLSQFSAKINGNEVSNVDCALGQTNPPANPANSEPGITCVIPVVVPNMSGSTVIFQLSNVPVTAAVPQPVSPATTNSFQVHAAAYDATGVGYDLTQTVTTTGVPTLTVAVATSPGTVNAATSATQANAAGNNVVVTYTYTVTNTSNYDSPKSSLTTNLNTTTAGPTLLSVQTSGPTPAASCDLTAAAGCDIPAHGSLTYTVTGVYLDSDFTGVATFPYTVTQSAPTATFSSPLLTPPVVSTGNAPSVMVNGTTTITANAITTNKSSFALGDPDVELTASFTNTGRDLASSYKATVILPTGYTATSSNCSGATSPYTSCTFSNIPAGSTVSFTITGIFNDTGTTADAVAPPMTASDPLTNVRNSVPSATVTAKYDVLNTGTMGTTYVTSAPAPAATSILVKRVNALTYAVGAVTPLAANTVNEFSPVHSSTTNDQLSYTVNVRNTGTSVARGVYFSIPVPASTSGTLPVVTVGSITYSSGQTAANNLTCSAVTGGPIVCYTNDLKTTPATSTNTPAPTTTAQTYTVNFITSYDETAVPQTVKTTLVTQGNGTIFADADTYNPATGLGVPASVTTSGGGASTSNVITIQRLTKVASTVNVSAVGSAAATNYSDKTHITLDSNSATSAPGTFDTILFQSATSNTGVNDAAGLSISITIPALSRVAIPQYCSLNGVAGPSATLVSVATMSTMVCTTPASTTNASSTALTQQLRTSAAACPAAPTPAAGTLSATSFDAAAGNCFQVAFYLKYADAPNTNTIVGANPTGPASYAAAGITENDIDTPTTPAATASAATTTIQRAAHLKLANAIAVPTYTTGAALGADASGNAQVAQGALHMDPTTRLVTSGKVFNCLRYTLNILNEGPNYVLNPTFGYGDSLTSFVPTQYAVGTVAADSNYVNCSTKSTTSGTTIPALAPTTVQNVFVDGYYDVGSIVAPANSGSATFATTPASFSGYVDSDTAGTAANDFVGTRAVNLVNTPANTGDSSAFGITAYGTTPQATLIFGNVSAAGITAALSSTTANCTAPTYDANHPAPSANVNICFPYGNSPVPKDATPIRNLYQPGAKPQYYQIPTTATVPSASTNNTTICFAMTGSAFQDIFVKPERTLLWVMRNGTAATKYNSFPAGYSGFTSPLAYQAGDITTLVTPYITSGAAGSYTVVPSSYTFPQIPQSQPIQICGTVNGLTTTPTAAAASAASAETFGVLEPVNFAPISIAGSIAASSAVSKGSTSALLDIYVQRAAGSTLNTYDYDDRDPCYTLDTAGSGKIIRQSCDDNPYLYATLYLGSDSTIGSNQAPARVSQLTPENVSGAPAGSYHLASNINLSASTNVFVAVSDQATGADSYNSDISNAVNNYGGTNPFVHQGNFLYATYSIASGSAPPLCDPGNSFVGGYSPVLAHQCSGTVGGTSSGFEGYVRGGADSAAAVNYAAAPDFAGNYYVLGNIGFQSVTASSLSGTGLIPLPYPGADPTTTNPPNAASPATATISAGQTAGFAWLWLSGVSNAVVANGSYPSDQYKLSCFQVDTATQNTAQAFSTGVTCSITTTTSTGTNDPSIYTFANASGNNGSSYPVIYVTTSSGLVGALSNPWKLAAEGITLAMLFPLVFFRRRLGRGASLAIVMVMLAASSLLTGCGSGGSTAGTPTGPITPSGQLYFRVMATPLTTNPNYSSEKPITSAPFVVNVH